MRRFQGTRQAWQLNHLTLSSIFREYPQSLSDNPSWRWQSTLLLFLTAKLPDSDQYNMLRIVAEKFEMEERENSWSRTLENIMRCVRVNFRKSLTFNCIRCLLLWYRRIWWIPPYQIEPLEKIEKGLLDSPLNSPLSPGSSYIHT